MRVLLMLLGAGLVFALLTACADTREVMPVEGRDGSSCTAETTDDGTLISCTDGSESFIPAPKDGTDGADGQDGEQGPQGEQGTPGEDAILEIIDPCGDAVGKPDEILLVLNDGQILAWYKDIGLSILICGQTYVTTDSQKCKFRLDADTCEYEELD